ncbi:MAG TPA: VOC family protein [Candidatus Dormibacteraeota bacterium]|nr:VOC family protein [Candidatus Dormibacteraeota bacterium]
MPLNTPLVDHIDLRVRDRERAKSFYDTLAPQLGLTVISESPSWVGYEPPENGAPQPFLGFIVDERHTPGETRIALAGHSREHVDQVAAAARAAGAQRMEGPELCADYSPTYYACFFEDPDGNKWEVCHRG